MNTERKYRKQLSENDWKIKLQRACFGGITPNFVGYCPFFWFTWFCVLITPIVLPMRGSIALLRMLIKHLPRPSKIERQPDDADLVWFYKSYKEHGLTWFEDHISFSYMTMSRYLAYLWVLKTEYWEQCCQDAVRRVDARNKREATKTARRARNAARLGRLTHVLGTISKFVLIGIASILSLLLLRAAWLLLRTVTLKEWLNVLGLLGIAILGVALIVGLFKLLQLPIRKGCRAIVAPIGGVAKFLFDTVETIYTRECPLIEWSNETRPIERRQN